MRLIASAIVVFGCSVGEVDSEGPDTIPSPEALTAANGIRLANGLNLANGATLPNGATLANGLNLANGLQFANGAVLSNGLNLANGVVAPDGVSGPYIFPSYCASSTRLCVGASCTTVASCTNSDLTKWIDANPTNNLLILQYEIQCALASATTVRVNYRGTLYTFVGSANLGADWQSGVMSQASQERVSSCLIARVNASGEHVTVDMFGPMTGLNTYSSSDSAYTFEEATVFGNLFATTPEAYILPYLGFTSCDTRACKTSAKSCNLSRTNTCDLVTVVDTYYVGITSATFAPLGPNQQGYATSVTNNGRTWNYPITTYLRPVSNGGACTFTQECASLFCVATTGACQACNANNDCPTGWACNSGTCVNASRTPPPCQHCK